MVYKIAKFLPIPLILLTIFLAVSINHYIKNGEFFIRDLDLKGGTSISFLTEKEVSIQNVSLILGEFGEKTLISISKTEKEYSVKITLPSEIPYENVTEIIKKSDLDPKDISVQFIGPELGTAFFSQVVYLLSIAYVLVFIGNFFIYRRISVATTILLSSFANIIYIFGMTTLLNIPITFAGFTSILLVIAYTIDSNILLSTKLLGSKIEEFYEQYKKTLITGVTISSSLILSMIIVLIFSDSPFLNNIAQVLLIGFAVDLINTYLLNAGIIEVSVFGKKR
ncbi:MAG: hypothetical protein RMJ18_00590 [Candidatus Aenigmarchaeota archaeon]|nr:hypothetical protein [Candidatus Aenigmarchaeota archaeon]MDW8159908.1 hypothetical protein [Candidatus Aenigmarchaeota archaeon]